LVFAAFNKPAKGFFQPAADGFAKKNPFAKLLCFDKALFLSRAVFQWAFVYVALSLSFLLLRDPGQVQPFCPHKTPPMHGEILSFSPPLSFFVSLSAHISPFRGFVLALGSLFLVGDVLGITCSLKPRAHGPFL